MYKSYKNIDRSFEIIKYYSKNRSNISPSPRNRRRNCNAWSTFFVNSRISQSCFQLCSTLEYRTDTLPFLKIPLSLSMSLFFFVHALRTNNAKKKRPSIRKRKKVFSPFFTPSVLRSYSFVPSRIPGNCYIFTL